ncbi:MAG: hypothetical protein TREMPRED_000844 [Tremellales sp. Tagirdzhanova-0007]|nr:MAG: hypothetical protein TREMPRED_000844 [Tremellales sp. Tagirdzhanova-0007]
MPKNPSTSPFNATVPISISSPILRSPDLAYIPNSPSPRLGATSLQGRRANGQEMRISTDGLGLGIGGLDEFYTPSPTHDYLEAFESYPSSPEPSHSPISRSPSMESSASATEKDPLDSTSRPNQYPSSRYLSPGPHSPYHGRARNRNRIQLNEKDYHNPRGWVPANPSKRRWLFCGVPAILIVAAIVAIAAAVASSRRSQSTSSSSSGSGSKSKGNSTASTDWGVAGSGKSGTIVTTDLGVNFTYVNLFGGGWGQDPTNPYSVSGQAQSYSPTLLEKWVWGQHIVRGVNLGGWLVTEPFIAPALYEAYQNSTPRAIDEYTLSQAMGSNLASAMEEHYKTFITEEDFADIANAGLNWVRIPLGYWAIETQGDEPFLAQVSWTYFLKAISWARKYGLRILLDFHALPGSQNGWNHSGKAGVINWMYGVMGLANGQRHLEYIRTLTEFISQDGIKEVVPILSLVNEVEAKIVGLEVMQAFYYQAYEVIRSITGFGTNNGPIIAIHEGFEGIAAWDGFLSGADRIKCTNQKVSALDQHPYLAFGQQNNNPWDVQIKTVCGWGGGTNDSQSSYGIILGDSTPAYTAVSNCTQWDEWFDWSDDTRAGLLGYSSATMDSLQNWFFWTWKIGNSTELGYPPSPFWHYKLGWQNGWIPADPRTAGGYCSRVAGVGGSQFNGSFPASAIGAVASPTIAAAEISNHSVWPPTSMGPSFTAAQIALFPTLTRTGAPISLATPTHPANATAVGNGWVDGADTTGAYVTISGCPYLDEYNATAASLVPTAMCTGAAKRTLGPIAPRATPVPTR